MPKPPIALRNLQGLTELMLLEELACKKCNAYAKTLKDPELKEMCNCHAEHHQQRFNAMNDYLAMHE